MTELPESWHSLTPEGAAGEERSGTRIGNYRLLQTLGEGGFGTVWMARQEEPIRRNVAVKILKLGMDTKQVVARFEAERQALALMDHPNIARVLDGGSTEQGRPYFVMELVKGVLITRYCDEAKLSMRERLGLFRQVCSAVQHAHQKGIIHRDLKPSNVLVTTLDGAAVPKVIDFGIAKALAAPLTERTMFTELGQMLGTPEYMAPEQAEASGFDVDTRADIYSLGVVLYELLTGTKPFDIYSLPDRAHAAILRTIREVDPPKPSTRVSTLGERATPIARQRGALPHQLGRSLRGDLDWIVMKAIEKERSCRYETAAALSDDLERFLSDRPVLASPPSRAHRLRKYVRRHRVGVAAAAAIVLSLLAGLVAAISGYIAASDQRDVAKAAEARATKEGARAQQVVDILNSMLGSADPYAGKEKVYTLRQFLDDFDANSIARVSADPEVEATVRGILGRAYRGLGDNEKAEKNLSIALDLRRKVNGPESMATLESLADWVFVPYMKGDYATAEREAREGLEVARRVAPESALVASYLYALGTAIDGGKGAVEGSQEAEPILREALALREKLLGPSDAKTGDALFALGCALRDGGPEKRTEAEGLLRRRIEILRRTKGPDDPNLAITLDNLARLATTRGDRTEAEKLLREAIELQRRRLGDEHPDLATTLCTLGSLRMDAGGWDEAEELLGEAAEIYRKSLGDDHPDLAVALEIRGVVKRDRGDFEGAEPLLDEASAIFRKRLEPNHPDLLVTLDMLAQVRRALGNLRGAEQLYRELDATRRRHLQAESPEVLGGSAALAEVLTEIAYAESSSEAAKEAESILVGLVELRRRTLDASDWRIGLVESLLADALAAEGSRLDEARALALRAWTVVSGPDVVPPPVRVEQLRAALERLVRVHETSECLAPGSTEASTIAEWKQKLQTLQSAR